MFKILVMKKIYVFAVAALMALQARAQNVSLDTYIGAQLGTEDLNGTARFVGMCRHLDH